MMNKRGDASIVVFVIFCVILLGSALYVFNVNSSQVRGEIKSARILDSIYLKEQQIDFYINEVIDRALAREAFEESGFALSLKDNLLRHEVEDILVKDDLLRIAEELDGEDVLIGENIAVSVNTQLVEKYEKIIVTYNYQKVFVR